MKTLKEIERRINFLLEDKINFGLTPTEEQELINLIKQKNKCN